MKRYFFSFFLISILLSGSVKDIDFYSDESFSIIAATLSDSTAYKRLGYMCDVFGHRLSGSKNLEDAIRWIIKEMKKDGISNVRGDKVKVPVWIRGDESIELIKPYKKKLNALGMGGSVSTPKGGIKGQVVVINDLKDLKKTNFDVKGKVVLFNPHLISYKQSLTYNHHGANLASENGAIACLVRSFTKHSLNTPHIGEITYSGKIKIPYAAITMEDAMMFDRLSNYNEKIIINMKMNAKRVADRWSKNIVGEIIGSKYPEQTIIVGGHIDSWDIGQGAHDNGGACIAAWEVLRILKKLNLKPKRTIRCVLWTNKENGLAGAKAYKKMYNENLKNHILAIESDAGVFSPLGFGFSGSPRARTIIKNIHKLLAPIGANKIFNGGRAANIATLNDEGVPVISLKVESEKYFWYHHSNSDTFDKVDFNEYARCIAALTIMCYVVADLDEPLPR